LTPLGKIILSWKRKILGGKGGMITMEKWTAIRQLSEQEYGKRTIAKMFGISRKVKIQW